MSFINISIQDLAALLSRRTVPQLKTTAKNTGIKSYSKMKKQQHIDAIYSTESDNRNQKQTHNILDTPTTVQAIEIEQPEQSTTVTFEDDEEVQPERIEKLVFDESIDDIIPEVIPQPV